MNILIRVDSSFTIGTGHLMRCLVLAKRYTLDNITFAVKELDGNINYKIDSEGYKKIILKSSSNNEIISIIEDANIDLLILDHYEISFDDEKEIKNRTDVKILAFDDMYKKHYCDILLNHNLSANPNRYKALVPLNCEIRCGSKFTLLREEFYSCKKGYKKIKKDKKKSIFVAIGGTDHKNINFKILNTLSFFKDIEVNIVTTNANRNLSKLIKYTNSKKWINLHIDSNSIASIMNNSDIAIITPSVVANEVIFMNIPFITIKTASNQNDIHTFLISKNFLCLNKFNSYKLKKSLNKLKLNCYYSYNLKKLRGLIK